MQSDIVEGAIEKYSSKDLCALSLGALLMANLIALFLPLYSCSAWSKRRFTIIFLINIWLKFRLLSNLLKEFFSFRLLVLLPFCLGKKLTGFDCILVSFFVLKESTEPLKQHSNTPLSSPQLQQLAPPISRIKIHKYFVTYEIINENFQVE